MSLDDVAGSSSFVRLHGLLDRCVVDTYASDFVSWGFYEPRYWRNYAHTHSFYEVCLAYSGRGTFTIDGELHQIETGSVFIARPGQVHEIISQRRDALGIAFWGFTLAPGRGSAPSRPGWWRGLLDPARPVLSYRLGRLPATIRALADEAEQPRSGQAGMLAGLGATLVIETARAFADEDDLALATRPVDRRSVAVAAMERYLLDNLARPLLVRDVAAVVHLSERHAERLFQSQTGESLMAALRRLRLERAARLLLESTNPVTEVARRSGYPEVRPFSTAFRRRYGQPPTLFRRTGGTFHLQPR
ncbi:helix-turn-helix domain-containing protein [Microlunatus parietis]|uniref:AraC-like DNA-binding protein n=1 Tax=Microlunatus parietis TaxID=682979 RepID=A0A7Y9LCJ8_9ACTN|nr:AraC family transcriptional regulator [Microlunatus parietis]NYE71908.1 AraC-like DNA-binding protein [Microlunatus parietis]